MQYMKDKPTHYMGVKTICPVMLGMVMFTTCKFIQVRVLEGMEV